MTAPATQAKPMNWRWRFCRSGSNGLRSRGTRPVNQNSPEVSRRTGERGQSQHPPGQQ